MRTSYSVLVQQYREVRPLLGMSIQSRLASQFPQDCESQTPLHGLHVNGLVFCVTSLTHWGWLASIYIIYPSVNQPSLVQITACCLVGARPFSDPVLGYCWSDPFFVTKIHKVSFKNALENVACKMATILPLPQFLTACAYDVLLQTVLPSIDVMTRKRCHNYWSYVLGEFTCDRGQSCRFEFDVFFHNVGLNRFCTNSRAGGIFGHAAKCIQWVLSTMSDWVIKLNDFCGP